MPTRNRRRFLVQAISSFLAQDYENRELIVVDDGEDAVADLIPLDDRIRYHRLDRASTIGAKRNLACALSRGGLIANFDDDDWHSPFRITAQVAALEAADVEACVLDEVIHYRPLVGDAWCSRDSGARTLATGTLVYRKSAWQATPFAEAGIDEARRLVDRIGPSRIAIIPGRQLYVALVHTGNARLTQPDPTRDQAVSLSEVAALLGVDAAFYASLRAGAYGGPRPVREAPLTFAAPFLVYDGYGSMSQYLALGMRSAGARVHIWPLRLDPRGLLPELLEMVRASRPSDGQTVLCFATGPDSLQVPNSRELFVSTMWETSRLPSGWAAAINRSRAAIVPSTFVAGVFKESGVTAPIEVLPLGVDPAVYHYQPRPNRGSVTTLMVGPICGRKNTLLGIEAWKRAFGTDPHARLLLKARFLLNNYTPDDARIQVVDSNEASLGIPHWYSEADVLMALGNEGFGLPLVEGMATGLPVIALDSEGQADICREASDLVLRVEPERYEELKEAPYAGCGVRGVPSVDKVAARLRWVANHRAEAAELGRRASLWALQHRNVWRHGPAVLEVMERRATAGRIYRRRRTVWPFPHGAPTLGTYAAQLCRVAISAELSPLRPELTHSRLLHIQQAPGGRGPWLVVDAIQRARALGLPVIMTEHSVGDSPMPGETDADVLIALTRADAEALRRRWPQRRVEHIPHGCPEWTRIRLRRNYGRRVIAAWGSLDRQEPWRLLEVARARGAKLVVAAPRCSQRVECAWRAASRGLAVGRVESRPDSEWVRSLAASADVFAHLGGEDRHQAMPAITGAMASGTPVVMRRMPGLEDLAAATLQADDPVAAVCAVLDDSTLHDELCVAEREYCIEHSWDRIADRHLALWRSVENT